MKKYTYPVATNEQAQLYRDIFKDDTKPGRVKGINNSPNLIKLFPESPFNNLQAHTIEDRANLLPEFEIAGRGSFAGSLTNDSISSMFSKIVDGITVDGKPTPHVLKQTGTEKNYNWLYRDKPMDMNYNYLNKDGEKNSPDPVSAPVGANAPIPDELSPDDKPFWGHANLQVPSVNPLEVRPSHENKPQLQRGSGGFGTVYEISNRAFASQEQIGNYFTKVYVANDPTQDRLDPTNIENVVGKSIIDRGTQSADQVKYAGDVDPNGVVIR